MNKLQNKLIKQEKKKGGSILPNCYMISSTAMCTNYHITHIKNNSLAL